MPRVATRPVFWWSIVGAVLLVSLVAVIVVAVREERQQDRFQEEEAERVATVLNTMSNFSIGQLRSLSNMVEASPSTRPYAFDEITSPLRLSHPAASFSYMAAVPADSAAAARQDGVRFSGVEVITRQSTLDGPLGALSPVDHHRDELARSLRRAGTDQVTATPGIRLRGADGHHLVLVYPVESPSGEPVPSGFIAAVLPVTSLLEGANLVAPDGTELSLISRTGEPFGDGVGDDYGSSSVQIGDREWELRLAAPGTASLYVPIIVGVIGLLIALGLTATVITWSRRERAAIGLANQRLDERDRAIRAEAESARMYRLLAEYMTDLVSVASIEGEIRYASPAAETLLGWRPEEMLGCKFNDFVHPDDMARNQERMQALSQAPGIDTFEHRTLCKDGTYIWVETACRSVEDSESGEVVELQATSRDISERKPLQQQLERLAWEDSLTGLANRRRFTEALESECARAERHGHVGAVMMIDIDEFKEINDSHGHLIGDLVIQEVASAIKARVRASDVLARLGGDEFAVILPETSLSEAEIVATDMVGNVSVTSTLGRAGGVTVSIGIAAFGAAGECDPTSVYDRADKAMYRAKSGGRDRIVVDGQSGRSPNPSSA